MSTFEGYGRPSKSYLVESLLTLVLYYAGLGIIGLIANLLFLRNARRDEESGVEVTEKGCLQALLWVHLALMILGCMAIVAVIALGGFGAILNSG